MGEKQRMRRQFDILLRGNERAMGKRSSTGTRTPLQLREDTLFIRRSHVRDARTARDAALKIRGAFTKKLRVAKGELGNSILAPRRLCKSPLGPGKDFEGAASNPRRALQKITGAP